MWLQHQVLSRTVGRKVLFPITTKVSATPSPPHQLTSHSDQTPNLPATPTPERAASARPRTVKTFQDTALNNPTQTGAAFQGHARLQDAALDNPTQTGAAFHGHAQTDEPITQHNCSCNLLVRLFNMSEEGYIIHQGIRIRVETGEERRERLDRRERCQTHVRKCAEKRARKKERFRLEAESELYQGPVTLELSLPGEEGPTNPGSSNSQRHTGHPSYSAGAGPSLPTPAFRDPRGRQQDASVSRAARRAARPPTLNTQAGAPSPPANWNAGYRPLPIPVRGPIKRRQMPPTREWRSTMARISKSIPHEVRLRGTRKQKSKIRRNERNRLRRAGDEQIDWFQAEVRRVIARYSVTEMEGKPPLYDFITAMWRESTQYYQDWAQRVLEHYEKTFTVWRMQTDTMDQVRKLESLYMDYTARFVLRMGYLESTGEREDKYRATVLRNQVIQQHREFGRFMNHPDTRYKLRALTHADIEAHDERLRPSPHRQGIRR